MKKLLFAITLVVIAFACCTKQNGTPVTPGTASVDTVANPPRFTGTFINGPYGTVSGSAKILGNPGSYQLLLQNLNSSNGPDLHVYLSAEVQPVNYADLGRLQSVAGDQLYTIPAGTDLTQFRYVLVHCQRFNHLFGSAAYR